MSNLKNIISFENIVKIFQEFSLPMPSNIAFLGSNVHSSIMVETENNIVFIVKIADGRNLAFSSFLKKEVTICNFLNNYTDIPVHETLIFSEKILEVPFIVKKYIDGVIGTQVRVRLQSNKEEEDRLFIIAGGILAKIHNATKKTIIPDIYLPEKDWHKEVKSRISAALGRCSGIYFSGSFFSCETLTKINNLMNINIGVIPQYPEYCLLHRDFKLRNLLFKNDSFTLPEICCVMDFEWSHYGDPFFDLASSDIYLKKIKNPFLEGYFSYARYSKPEDIEKILSYYTLLDKLEIIGRTFCELYTSSPDIVAFENSNLISYHIKDIKKLITEIEKWQ